MTPLPKGRRLRWAVAAACAGVALFPGIRAPVAAVLAWTAGLRLADRAARRAAERRAAAVDRAIGEICDLLVVCVRAGLGVERALRSVAPSADGPAGAALRGLVAALDVGVERPRAYEGFARQAGGVEAARLAGALMRAERFGLPVASALEAHAAEVRSRARTRADAEARRTSVAMLFPLAACFVPAFVLLTIAPVALSALRMLGL